MITRPPAGRLVVCDENTNCPEEFFDLRNSKRCWNYPLGRSSISADVAQYSDSCILFGDGKVASWVETDEDVSYKVGDYTLTKKKLLKLTPPLEVERIVKIASGFHYFFALREDGEAFVWGDEKWKKTPELHPPNKRLQGVVDIDISKDGGLHVLTTEGRVISWGGKYSNKHPKNLCDIVRIQNTVGISKSGELICWGKDAGGYPTVPIPKKLPKIKEVGVFGYGAPGSAITHDGKVRGIGYNHDVIDEELGSLKGKVIQAVGDGKKGCILLFDDQTVRYFDYSHHFRDEYKKNEDLECSINGQRNILSIGNTDTGVWAIQKEDKAPPKKAKSSTPNKKK
jgi:hypothetical protein